jgi:hypothetical protein
MDNLINMNNNKYFINKNNFINMEDKKYFGKYT